MATTIRLTGLFKRGLTFRLDGPPQGKGRARSAPNGHHYTPAKTVAYETRLAYEFKMVAGPDWTPIEGPVSFIASVVFAIPTSWSGKKRAAALAGTIRPTVKPDTDNVSKLKDGLNGIAWRDDAQVVYDLVVKTYGEQPGVTITIQEV